MSKNSLPMGSIQLSSSYKAQDDNDYRISLTPNLPTFIGADPADIKPVYQFFSVSGVRFSLPGADIHARSPAPQSTGKFDAKLPHIVFNKRVLPWERRLTTGADPTIPWLALLVFFQEELPRVIYFPGVVQDIVTPELSVLKPQIILQSSDQPKDPCNFIRIPIDLFTAIAPGPLELKLLAHCCDINSSLSDSGSFAVIKANRFPQPGDKNKPVVNIVHLVSLEGCHPYLGPTHIDAETKTAKTIQLVSLANWSFNCSAETNQQETFQGAISQIIDQSTPQSPTDRLDPKLPLLRSLPDKSLQSQLDPDTLARLGRGNVLLPFHCRTGEDTVGWYHGPLTPEPVEPLTCFSQTDLLHSDALLIYEAKTGVFDISYATAWQLGRSLALADPDFSQRLVSYRWQVHHQTDKLLYQQRRHKQLGIKTKTTARHHLFSLIDKEGLLHDINRLTSSSCENKLTGRLKSIPDKLTTKQRLQQRQALLPICLDRPDLVEIIKWLQTLRREVGVPFENMVADESMLPNESIRFFHVDPNWLRALTLGALSIGVHSTNDKQINAALLTAWDKQQIFLSSDPVCGMLLRSTAVSSWPGLTIELNKGDSSAPQVRYQQYLSPDVLFYLWSAIPTAVTLCEPHEQLGFGVEGDKLSEGFIYLRHISGNNLGQVILSNNSPISIPFAFRDTSNRVLDLAQLSAALVEALDKQGEKPADGKMLNSAEMAIELIRVPLKAQFLPLSNLTIRAQPRLFVNFVNSVPPLNYSLTPSPDPIQASTKEYPRDVNLTFVVSSVSTLQPVYLKSIKITISAGKEDKAQALTSISDIDKIESLIEDHASIFQIHPLEGSKNIFMITPIPQSGTFAPIRYHGFSVYLNKIRVNQQVGSCNISISDSTATDAKGSNLLTTDSEIKLTKFPESFSISNFAASETNVLSGSLITLSWVVQNVSGAVQTLSWNEFPSGVDVTHQTSYSVTIPSTTTFTLAAYVSSQVYSLQETVTAFTPQVMEISKPIQEDGSFVVSAVVDIFHNRLFLCMSKYFLSDSPGSIWIVNADTFETLAPSPIPLTMGGILILDTTHYPLNYLYVVMQNVLVIAIEESKILSQDTIIINKDDKVDLQNFVFGLDAAHNLLYLATLSDKSPPSLNYSVSIINTKSKTLLSSQKIEAEFFIGMILYNKLTNFLALDIDNNCLFIIGCTNNPNDLLNPKENYIAVIDINTLAILKKIPGNFMNLALDTRRGLLYASIMMENTVNVSVIDSKTMTVINDIENFLLLFLDRVNNFLYGKHGDKQFAVMDMTQNSTKQIIFNIEPDIDYFNLVYNSKNNKLYGFTGGDQDPHKSPVPVEVVVIGNKTASPTALETKLLSTNKPAAFLKDFKSSSMPLFLRSFRDKILPSEEKRPVLTEIKKNEVVTIHIKDVKPIVDNQYSSIVAKPVPVPRLHEVKSNHRRVLIRTAGYLMVANVLRTATHIGLLGTIARKGWEEKSPAIKGMAIVEAGYGGMTLIGLATRSCFLRNQRIHSSKSAHPLLWILIVGLAASASSLLLTGQNSNLFFYLGLGLAGIGVLSAGMISSFEVKQSFRSAASKVDIFYQPVPIAAPSAELKAKDFLRSSKLDSLP